VASAGDQRSGTPAGIIILGAPLDGAELEDFLVQNGFARSLSAPSVTLLGTTNDRLLGKAGGTPTAPLFLAHAEIENRLQPLREEARGVLFDAVRSAAPGPQPWVWWHPLNAFVADFWANAADGDVALLHAVGPPGPAVGALAALLGTTNVKAERVWSDLQRAALSNGERRRSMVVSTEALDEPKTLADKLGLFLDLPTPSPESMRPLSHQDPATDATVEVARTTTVLWNFLEQLGTDNANGPADKEEALVATLQGFYDETYYEEYETGVPYRRGIEAWERFFESVSGRIAATIRPRTVLDAGCAMGFLVEGLRERGVEASGFDISPFAISQAPAALAPFLSVRSITEEIEGHYDLITCFEVVEHLPAHLGEVAIANMCRHTDAVLFSSAPEDFDELSHINLHPMEEWAQRFADHGFHRDFSYDASFVAPQAVLFRRGRLSIEQAIDGYEQRLWKDGVDYRQQVATAQEDARRAEAVTDEAQEAQHQAEQSLTQLRLRRAAEVATAAEARDETMRQQTLLASLVEAKEAEAQRWKREVETIHQTKVFRYSRGLRRIYGLLRRRGRTSETAARVVGAGAVADESTAPVGGSYELWCATYDTLTDDVRDVLRERTTRLTDPPVFSILVPVFNTPEPYLRSAIESVRRQLYPHWQLCVADDCSTEEHVGAVLAEYAAIDDRISVVRREDNGHISAASNSALGLATGSWVVLLDHDDELAEHALAVTALAIADHPEVSFLYSDEDKLDAMGRRFSPFFKPDFDPTMLLGENYPCHLFVARREIVEELGGFRVGFEGSQDWDLVLRVTERLDTGAIHHIPHILYHWRAHSASTATSGSAKPYAAQAGLRAVEEHLIRTGQRGSVTWSPATGRNRVRWHAGDDRPLVSIIIPTRDGASLIRCVNSVRRQTEYDNYEFLVVDNGSRTAPTLDFFRAHEDWMTVIRDERPFNYSALHNSAVQHARGDLLLLLNDDVEVMGGDWLEEMVTQVMRPRVGIVGAKLDYPNGSIQHAGVTLGVHGVAGHLHRGADRFDLGYFGDLALTRQVSAVTGACMLVRRNVYEELGGLDAQELAIAFNDIDFCLKAREAGWNVIWTPFAELIHHESISRGRDDVGPRADEFRREVACMQSRWAHVLRHDPAYNPNLTLLSEHAELAWPPRVSLVHGAR
jgi:GT2 family glycosyltransferase/2-polyprenyl-3-methyl-5-hydroxy-6-metoxy-1,4-benzoquinol methylase